MILSTFIGTGIQLFTMLLFSMFFSAFGSSRPESRANLASIMIFSFVFMSFLAGYFSSRVYRNFNEQNWVKNAILTATLYPGFLFIVFFVMNFFYAVEQSSSALKFTRILFLLLLWIFCSGPLVFMGSFLASKQRLIKLPCKINSIPSPIPKKPWYFRIKYLIWVTGFIPFG